MLTSFAGELVLAPPRAGGWLVGTFIETAEHRDQLAAQRLEPSKLIVDVAGALLEQGAGVTAGTRGGLRTIAPMEPSGAEVRSAEQSRRRGRWRPTRRRRAVIVVAAALAGVAVIGVAGLSFVRGTEWKERADERGARITDLEDELRASEAELQALEDRVDELTEEVTVAQDQLFVAELDADQAQELAALAGAVARDLASCVDGTSELVRIVRELEGYDSAAATDYAEQVDAVCGRALAGNDLLQDSLG
jgi:hypothetical protein